MLLVFLFDDNATRHPDYLCDHKGAPDLQTKHLAHHLRLKDASNQWWFGETRNRISGGKTSTTINFPWLEIRTNSTPPSHACRCWWGLTAWVWHLQNLLNRPSDVWHLKDVIGATVCGAGCARVHVRRCDWGRSRLLLKGICIFTALGCAWIDSSVL